MPELRRHLQAPGRSHHAARERGNRREGKSQAPLLSLQSERGGPQARAKEDDPPPTLDFLGEPEEKGAARRAEPADLLVLAVEEIVDSREHPQVEGDLI